MTIKRVVLGADDPEMRAIETVCAAAGVQTVYALSAGAGYARHSGRRVCGAEMYLAAAPDMQPGDLWVECMAAACIGTMVDGVQFVDHHRPGDHGYGRPPAEFWAASSLGQVVAALLAAGYGPQLAAAWGDAAQELGMRAVIAGALIPPTDYDQSWYVEVADGRSLGVAWGEPLRGWGLRLPGELPLIAAADHCLGAAYAGRCPGVNPDILLDWRLTASGSPHTSEPDGAGGRRAVPAGIVMERAALARYMLSEAWTQDGGLTWAAGLARIGPIEGPDGRLDAVEAIDLRRFGSATVGLPIADVAARVGRAYILSVREGYPDRTDGREKVVLGGCGEGSVPGVVPMPAWESWCRGQGYTGEVYGDPARGFAGCYLA